MSIISIGNTTLNTESSLTTPVITDLTVRITKAGLNSWDVYIKSNTGSLEKIGAVAVDWTNVAVSGVSFTAFIPPWPLTGTGGFGAHSFLFADYTGQFFNAGASEVKILNLIMNNDQSLGSIFYDGSFGSSGATDNTGVLYTVDFIFQP